MEWVAFFTLVVVIGGLCVGTAQAIHHANFQKGVLKWKRIDYL